MSGGRVLLMSVGVVPLWSFADVFFAVAHFVEGLYGLFLLYVWRVKEPS